MKKKTRWLMLIGLVLVGWGLLCFDNWFSDYIGAVIVGFCTGWIIFDPGLHEKQGDDKEKAK